MITLLFESLREVLLTFDAGGEVARGGTERDRLKRVEEDSETRKTRLTGCLQPGS